MTENKRFMVDDCGTLIDMVTRDTYDYVSDVCDLLNEQHETMQQFVNIARDYNIPFEKLTETFGTVLDENEQLKQRNDRQYNQLKQLWELIEDEDYNTLRSMLNQRETDEKLLRKEWGTYSD